MSSRPLLTLTGDEVNVNAADLDRLDRSGAPHLPNGAIALSLLSLLSVLQGLSWAPFSSLPALSQKMFDFDDGTLTWQQNVRRKCRTSCTVTNPYLIDRHAQYADMWAMQRFT